MGQRRKRLTSGANESPALMLEMPKLAVNCWSSLLNRPNRLSPSITQAMSVATLNVREQSIITLPFDEDHGGWAVGKKMVATVSQLLPSVAFTFAKGGFTNQFEQALVTPTGGRQAVARSSGAVASDNVVLAIAPESGEEIITMSVAVVGAFSATLMQGAMPRLADVDMRTCNVTMKTTGAVCRCGNVIEKFSDEIAVQATLFCLPSQSQYSPNDRQISEMNS